MSHHGWVLALLVLSLLPLRLTPLPFTGRSANQSEQHEAPDGKLYEQAKLHANPTRLRRVRLLWRAGGTLPPSKPQRVHTVALKSLVHEDPRHDLLPRWTAPPEPDSHA